MSFFSSRWVEPPAGTRELDPSRLAPGFRAAGLNCGIKQNGKPDLGLVVCDVEEPRSAALFTTNAAAAAPVLLSREARLGALRGVVANSGCANCATGEQGMANAIAMQAEAAEATGAAADTWGVASTGGIASELPMDLVGPGVRRAAEALSTEGGADFAEAILTTDVSAKHCTVELDGVTLSAQAKGAGMIQPGYATTLCFIQTDALIDDPHEALVAATAPSFERITVDGQQSTNDSIFLQSSGLSGRPLPAGLLEAVMLQLALAIVADGEGASRVARLSVDGAASPEEAERVARAVANSPLVQTAVFGRDPNWGRIVQAAGMALAGEIVEFDGSSVEAAELAEDTPECEISIDLRRGEASSSPIYFSDLTYDYVRLNAEYDVTSAMSEGVEA